MRRVERVIEIGAPVERVFDLFGDFEGFPRWMRHVCEVRRTGRRYTRWRACTPRGLDIEWETETTVFEPDHRIVWRSVGGDVETDGEAVFSEIDQTRTRVRVVLGYAPPPGRRGDAFARLFGRDPAAELAADLHRFKGIAERRAPRPARAHDEYERREPPRAPLERTRRREARYAEARAPRERAEPRSDERYYRDVLGMRGRDEQRGGERTGPAARPRRYQEDGELERERRFDEALRAARRGQIEDLRRYRTEGRPSPAWRRMLEAERRIETRRRAPVEGPPARGRGRADEPERPRREELERAHEEAELEAQSRPPRYALTPRERERERAERGWDREAKRRVLRRSVDRLLDEGPSRAWRRWERESE